VSSFSLTEQRFNPCPSREIESVAAGFMPAEKIVPELVNEFEKEKFQQAVSR